MTLLVSCDNPQVKYHSSITQHKNTLCVMKKGEWCPIAFDEIVYISCDKIKTRRVAVTDGEDVSYHFGVKTCPVYTNQFLFHDEHQTVIMPLPEWYGTGFYTAEKSSQALINADNGALGVSNRIDLQVGTNYAISDILPAVE